MIGKSSAAAPAAARIDKRKPSGFAELYGFTRVVTKPEGKWLDKRPVIAPIGAEKPLLVKDWTLETRPDAPNDKRFTFTLSGSKTGAGWSGPQP